MVEDSDLTELSAASDTATRADRAWALDDSADVAPEPWWTPGRITTAAVAGAVVAVGAAGVVGWQQTQRPAEPVASPTPTTTTTPPLDPTHLNGLYRVEYDWVNTSRRGRGSGEWTGDGGVPADWMTMTTACTDKCIATGQMLTPERKRIPGARTIVLELRNGAWEEIGAPRAKTSCSYADGSLAGESWSTVSVGFAPRPDGSFVGTMTTVVETDECGDRGDTVLTPITVQRVSDTD